MRLLVVEDDARIAADILATLSAAGYVAEAVDGGEEAWFRGETEEYDLIVLDLGLPGMDGLTVLKRWRAGDLKTPVLVLTARGAWAERVEGIDAGADDYLPKPFRMEELVARVRALIRRSVGQASPTIDVGPLRLDPRRMTVTRNDVPVSLSPLEFRLVSYLMHHKGRVVSGSELVDHLYGENHRREANALEAVVARLRRKLGASSIETKREFGYLIAAAPE